MSKPTVQFSARLEPEDKAYIEASAGALNLSMAELVRRAVREYVKNYRQHRDAEPEDKS